MADVVVIGAGVNGLAVAMLLARDGHRVTVLERDPADPVDDPHGAWEGWERRGVSQFRMLHLLLPRWREEVAREIPEILDELDRRGALRFNFVTDAPESITGGHQAGDDRFGVVTARRPVVESAVAAASGATEGLTVRRGVGVAGLLTGEPLSDGIRHVIGVRTDGGEDLRADLVIDAGGRRSALPRLLDEVGAPPPMEEIEDSGFVYYGRHFRSSDGSVPPALGGLLQHYGTISILTLPADNGTWGVGVIASARDSAMRSLKDPLRWEAVVSMHPLVAHWVDGEPISDGVAVMAKIEDRCRRLVVDGVPVATGIVAVGDSWACTNPSLGRGISIGLMHAVALRDTVRAIGFADPAALTVAFDEVTQREVDPWYRATLWYDRHRLAEVESLMAGHPYEFDDPGWEIVNALTAGMTLDGTLFRAFVETMSLLASGEEVFSRPGLVEKVLELGGGWRDQPMLAPAREELLATVGG